MKSSAVYPEEFAEYIADLHAAGVALLMKKAIDWINYIIWSIDCDETNIYKKNKILVNELCLHRSG